MKYLAILFILAGCATTKAWNDGSDVQVIKYQQFGKVQWDFISHVVTDAPVPYYVKHDGSRAITNYLRGDFRIMTLADYDREGRK